MFNKTIHAHENQPLRKRRQCHHNRNGRDKKAKRHVAHSHKHPSPNEAMFNHIFCTFRLYLDGYLVDLYQSAFMTERKTPFLGEREADISKDMLLAVLTTRKFIVNKSK